jgi:hypothetical protein
VPLGSFNILGEPGKGILDTQAAALGHLADNKWSKLAFSTLNGLRDLDSFKAMLRAELGGSLGNEVVGILDALTAEQDANGLTIAFPILDDPGGKAMAFLLGQESDLVVVKANFELKIDKRFDLSPIPGIIVGLQGRGSFTAYAQIGYDTVGIRETIAPIYNGGGFAPAKAFDGIWIDRNTRLAGAAGIDLVGGVGVTNLAELTVSGGTRTSRSRSRTRATRTGCVPRKATWAIACSPPLARCMPRPRLTSRSASNWRASGLHHQ